MIDVMDGDRTVDPDSGVPSACNPQTGRHYEGVRGGGQYYEPDSSDGEDGRRLLTAPGGERGERPALERGPRLPRPARPRAAAVPLGRPRRAVVRRVRQPRRADPGQPAAQPGARGVRHRLREAHGDERRDAGERRGQPSPPRATTRRTCPTRPTCADRDRAYGSAFDGGAPTVAVAGRQRAGGRCPRPSGWRSTSTRAGRPTGPRLRLGQPGAAAWATTRSSPRRGVRFIVLDSIAETGGDGGNLDPTAVHLAPRPARQGRRRAASWRSCSPTTRCAR